jgi:hypothetical protein
MAEAAAPAVKKATKAKVPAAHPPYAAMIADAIKELGDKKGSSHQAILKYKKQKENVVLCSCLKYFQQKVSMLGLHSLGFVLNVKTTLTHFNLKQDLNLAQQGVQILLMKFNLT